MMSITMWAWWGIGLGLVLWLIALSLTRSPRTPSDGMVCSMSTGTATGTGVGVYLPVVWHHSFFSSALFGFAAGAVVGWLIGWKSGVRGVLEGTVAGWMGGLMGAMTAVMVPAQSGVLLFRLTSVLVAGVLFMVFLLLSAHRSSTEKGSSLFSPLLFFVVILGFLMVSHFHSPASWDHGPMHEQHGAGGWWV
ncbi:hypothetical protein SAMN04488112_10257 [Melghirimyces thermohalophilus]|uniref:Uncharacterized protein n=2 Tax=Melghirimyces thermohalophilus TaxID=1236220 RepID=A0A1G6I511_9BACL|nr:hypothetical protein SAMN04488112_10257 [Melghirimyces thermohalophilus]